MCVVIVFFHNRQYACRCVVFKMYLLFVHICAREVFMPKFTCMHITMHTWAPLPLFLCLLDAMFVYTCLYVCLLQRMQAAMRAAIKTMCTLVGGRCEAVHHLHQ
jgi:hypothetical protein